jgi:hypothetical protein
VKFGEPLLPVSEHPVLIDSVKPGNCTKNDDGTFSVWPIDTKGEEHKWRQGSEYLKESIKALESFPETKELLDKSPDDARGKPPTGGGMGPLLNSNNGNPFIRWNNYRFQLSDSEGNYTKDPLKITRIDISEIRWYTKFKTVWTHKKYNADTGGTKLLTNMFTRDKNIFDNPKSVHAVKDCLYSVVGNEPEAYVLDYFGGSGTTCHATMLLNKSDGGHRKFILVEQGEYFNTIVLPRIKKAAFSLNADGWIPWEDESSIPTPQDNPTGIGIFVKYYKLEQYEDVLLKSELYTKENPPKFSKPEDYGKYIFTDDPKLIPKGTAKSIEMNENILKKIYKNIDLAETLSCLNGKMITKQEKDKVIFEEKEINLKKIKFNDIKDLIWW